MQLLPFLDALLMLVTVSGAKRSRLEPSHEPVAHCPPGLRVGEGSWKVVGKEARQGKAGKASRQARQARTSKASRERARQAGR
jgi:hypothetical protein